MAVLPVVLVLLSALFVVIAAFLVGLLWVPIPLQFSKMLFHFNYEKRQFKKQKKIKYVYSFLRKNLKLCQILFFHELTDPKGDQQVPKDEHAATARPQCALGASTGGHESHGSSKSPV